MRATGRERQAEKPVDDGLAVQQQMRAIWPVERWEGLKDELEGFAGKTKRTCRI
jgi:hypothetical protein